MAKKKTARADGRYQGKLLVAVEDGRPKYRYVYGKTQKEVNDKLADLRVKLGQGVDLTQERALTCWIERWLRRTAQTQTEDWHATCEARAKVWDARLGRADVTRITAADLEDVLFDLARANPRTGRPSSRKTLTEYKNVISQIFDLIVQNRVISFNPAQYLTVRKDAPKETREALTDAQIAGIRATPDPVQLPCLIMIYAGLRLGELAALTWSDIDLTGRAIRINKSWNFKQLTVKTTKTAAGTRTVPIPEILLPFLTAAPRASLLVCPHTDGNPFTSSAWKFALAKYCRLLGFETTAHCLRHTYCTILFEAGVDVLTAKELMGHADISTTMKIYTHLRDRQKASSITRLDAYLSTAEPASKTAEK